MQIRATLLKSALGQLALALGALFVGGIALGLLLGSVRLLLETIFYGALILGGAYYFLGRPKKGKTAGD